jgi:hypothetical protein
MKRFVNLDGVCPIANISMLDTVQNSHFNHSLMMKALFVPNNLQSSKRLLLMIKYFHHLAKRSLAENID